MDYKTKVNDLMWSGNRKILRWDRANFFDLLGQMTAQEIEIMNAYLDSEGYDVKGLSDSQDAYREDVLITYIKDWLKLTVEVDAVDMVKDFCDIYCAIMVTQRPN